MRVFDGLKKLKFNFSSELFEIIQFQFTKSEVSLSKAVMTYWTNFAKTGSVIQKTFYILAFKTKLKSKDNNQLIMFHLDKRFIKFAAVIN